MINQNASAGYLNTLSTRRVN